MRRATMLLSHPLTSRAYRALEHSGVGLTLVLGRAGLREIDPRSAWRAPAGGALGR
jgi:hypothetical protein